MRDPVRNGRIFGAYHAGERRPMDFRKLNYIMKVVETGNITKAAEELYITQPALSHFLTNTEAEEGIKLFDRSTAPIRLTYAGEKYIAVIRQILELNESLKTDIEEIKGEISGHLTIGIPPARATDLLPDILPEFMARYPKVEVSTVEHNTRQLREDIRRQNVDIAILPVLDGLEEFRCIPLFREELFLVAEQGRLDDHHWHLNEDGEKVVEIRNLKDEPFILLKKGHGIRDKIDFLFQMNDVKPRILMETTNNETAFSLAAAGLGLAIVPAYNIRSYVPRHSIDIYKISESGLTWDVAAITEEGTALSRHVRACIEIIREKYRNQKTLREENDE